MQPPAHAALIPVLRDAIWIAALSLASPATAQRISGPGGSGVYPLQPPLFEVAATTGNARVYRCGAAKYARRQRAAWNTPIVVAGGIGPSVAEQGRRTAVPFTLAPQAAGITPVPGARLPQTGAFRTVTEANRGCSALDNYGDR